MAAEAVERYIAKQKSPQKEICRALREIIRKAFPGIGEEMRMGVPWYGGRFYIAAFGDHVNLGFPVEGLSKENLSLFEGNGRYMRHVKIFSDAGIDKKRIRILLKMAKKSRCSCP